MSNTGWRIKKDSATTNYNTIRTELILKQRRRKEKRLDGQIDKEKRVSQQCGCRTLAVKEWERKTKASSWADIEEVKMIPVFTLSLKILMSYSFIILPTCSWSR